MWLPAVPGNPGEVANWPGVWPDGQHWPEDGEIDIAEGIGGQVCAHLHDAVDPRGYRARRRNRLPQREIYGWLAYLCRELGAWEHDLLL